MEADLTSLEQKVENVVAFCERLREENLALRGRIAGLESEKHGLENEKKALAEKIDTTRERLEALMDRLPNE